MIIITGANGQLGRAVVERLLTRMPAEQIGVSVRNPEQAQELKQRGVRVRRGDFEDPASLTDSFEGASQVLLVSSNNTGEVAVRHHRTAIDAARKVGAYRILYTSHMGASPASHFSPMVAHATTEVDLQKSGVAYTALRNGFYASTVPMLLGSAIQTGELVAPEDGPVSWTTHADLAEVAAVALSSEVLDGTTPPLTASEAIDLAGIATIVSELAQRPIRRIVVSDEEYRATLIANGLPEIAASMTLSIFQASRLGDFAQVDATLARLIGRSPQTLRDFLRQTLNNL
jgi:NAD(P)H dehydrogenase (quinone)